ncbi:MAG TPA: hypothetical protein VMB50_18285 [Myxococcales bacterium]|nr:hypothetical protein [Myxococcales bacterium]
MKRASQWFPGRKCLISGAALAVLLGTLLALPTPALAQDDDKVVHEADKTVYKKKTVIDFNDVTLEGDLTKPEGSYILNRRATKFGSLIKLRDNFNPELQKSVDNL